MKPLIKYPVTLFVLLLVGYTQVFAHLYRVGMFSPEKEVKQSTHVQPLALKTTGLENVYIEEEEEDDRLSFKKHFVDSSFFSCTKACQYLFQQNISYSHISESFFRFTSLTSPYLLFRVFRL